MVSAEGQREKRAVALSSVVASSFLTAGKLIVGILTGSLGILSEAAHSALDLGAAAITYFAVRVSDMPADDEHHYGHGKIENFSALIEAVFLFITCFWIMKEAVERLFFKEVHFEINFWSFAIILVSIVVDISRSRALSRAAKKYNSQALEADALHFSSDVLSSIVVLIGLVLGKFGINSADPVAALIVALIVIAASWKLARRTVDVLLDKAPQGLNERIVNEVIEVPGVAGVHKVRLRQSGGTVHGDLHVVIDRNLSFVDGHRIADMVEEKLAKHGDNILVHFEPEDNWEDVQAAIEKARTVIREVMSQNNSDFADYHDLEVSRGPGGTSVRMHLVLPHKASVKEARECCDRIEERIKEALDEVKIDFHIEPCDGSCQRCNGTCKEK